MTWRTTAPWLLAGALALVFVASGVPKVVGAQEARDNFEKWGYPDWFRPVVGTTELLAALLLISPRLRVAGASARFWGAAGLTLLMAGAAATHLRLGEGPIALLPLTLLGACAVLALATRPPWLRRHAATGQPTTARFPTGQQGLT
jgi:putative oxidoreductase